MMKRTKTVRRMSPSRTENLFLETAKTPSIRTEIKTKMEVVMNGAVLVIDSGLAITARPMTSPEFVMLVPIMLPRARPGLRIREA